jgi:hypothetical protein
MDDVQGRKEAMKRFRPGRPMDSKGRRAEVAFVAFLVSGFTLARYFSEQGSFDLCYGSML